MDNLTFLRIQNVTNVGNTVWPQDVNVTETPGPTCVIDAFDLVVNVLITGVLCIFGLIGNTLSIVVLRYERSSQAAIFLLQSLAVSDNLLLVLVFTTVTLASGIYPRICLTSLPSAYPYIIKYVNPVGYTAQAAIIWMTVLIAFNRYVAICKPFQANSWITLTRTKLQVLVVAVSAVIFNVPRVFQVNIKYKNNGSVVAVKPTSIGRGSVFSKVYTEGIYTILVLILPLLILVVLKVKPIRELYRMRNSIRKSIVSGRTSSEENISLIMVLIIIIQVICHTPDRIYGLLVIYAGYSEHVPYYFQSICNLLVTFNSSTNFIIYYVLRRRFRNIILYRLCKTKASQDYLDGSFRGNTAPLVERHSSARQSSRF